MNWMKRLCCLAIAVVMVSLGSSAVFAQSLESAMQDSNQWAVPLGDYAATRHSKLNQINAGNASKLQVAWTMSTGTLRGQDGRFPARGRNDESVTI